MKMGEKFKERMLEKVRRHKNIQFLLQETILSKEKRAKDNFECKNCTEHAF